MTTFVKRLVTGTAVLAAASAGLLIAPTTASAASYNGVCGSGYAVIDHYDLGSYGTMYLTYNSSNGNNCVVTVRNSPGAKLWMTAGVKRSGTDWSTTTTDAGSYSTYAGPKYVYAPGSCIDWGGQINGVGQDFYNTHCG
ncbi:spore-associated protein A [Kitasatospora sp. NPDC056138]|uniref:spore-associated protein A n=1 Tax=Kitasatospora sp. NPDC056138 TaxID=3345724 RepID=UPI0035D908C7